MTNEFRIPNAFNPDLFTKEQAKAIFSVRLKKFDRLFSEIKIQPNAETPQEHLLILGERGMGKTTFLRRLHDEIEDDPELSWILPLRLNEEENGITKLFKLWETLAKLLEAKYVEFSGIYEKIDNYYLLNSPTDEQFERYAFSAVFGLIEKNRQKITLFIDNFGDMISRISEMEQKRFREIIQEYPRLKIIAGSAVVSESFYNYKDPLFESFKTIHLTGLSEQETLDMLLNLGEFYKRPKIKTIIETQPNRILTLHRLTGGNIRIIMLLFELLVNNEDSSFLRDFIGFIDRLTTFYAQKMKDIKGERREIIEVLSLNWDAMSVEEVAKKIRQENNHVFAQLNQLYKDDIIENKSLLNSDNPLYQVKDRFFNIWYLMRYGRTEKDKVLFLVRFFGEWLDRFESNDRARLVVKEYWEKNYDPITFRLVGVALSKLDELTLEAQKELREALDSVIQSNLIDINPKYDIMRHSDIRKKYFYNTKINDYDINLFRDDLISAPLSLEAKAKIIKVFSSLDSDKFERIWQVLKKETQKLYSYALKNFSQQFASCGEEGIYLSIVETLFNTDLDLAILYINKIKDSECEDIPTRLKIADLYFRIAERLNQEKDFIRAETSYTEAIRFGNVAANFKLAQLYESQEELKNLSKADFFYKESLRLGYKDKGENLFRLAYTYFLKKQYHDSEKYFLQSLKIQKSRAAVFNLVEMYAHGNTEIHDIEKAEQLLINTLNEEKDLKLKAGYHNSLAWLYFSFGIKREQALFNSDECNKLEPLDFDFLHTYADILLWSNHFKKSFEIAEKFMYNEDYLGKSEYEQLTTYFLLLCAKKQYDFLYNYFIGEKGVNILTKDRFRPIYFALMHLIKDKYPFEYLKMGSELEVTVNEILAKIEVMSIKYK